jgi:hypothetical protein
MKSSAATVLLACVSVAAVDLLQDVKPLQDENIIWRPVYYPPIYRPVHRPPVVIVIRSRGQRWEDAIDL